MADDRKLIRTRHPGIFKRGTSYVVVFHVNGRQKKAHARSLAEARKLKAARTADVARGEFHEASRVSFQTYAEEWILRYAGNGRGFRESTRTDYRRHLERHAYRYFGDRKRLAEINPRDVGNFIGWLCNEDEQGRRLTDKTVRNVVGTLRACLATAVREGLIRHNPARDTALPHRPRVEEEDEDHARVLDREQVAEFLATVDPTHRLMFRFVAATGLRWSEFTALTWGDLELDAPAPHVRVRRALVRGVIGPPKSKYGRRSVPLSGGLVFELHRHRRDAGRPGDDRLVFPSQTGTPLHHSNVLSRVLRPAAEEVGAPWAGFHTFRHTCASMLFERGANAVQVQRWLGHHSAAFTLATYVHLLGDSVGEPLVLEDELAGATHGATSPQEATQDAVATMPVDLAVVSEMPSQHKPAQAALGGS